MFIFVLNLINIDLFMKIKHLSLILALAGMSTVSTTVYGQGHSASPGYYYLEADQVANSKELLPPPPAENTMRYAYDVEQYEWGKSMRDTPRGKMAVEDADLGRGWIERTFNDAFGVEISREKTPEIYNLVYTTGGDAGHLAVGDAKDFYMRRRPFMVFEEQSATPDHEEGLRKNGSYPSGHTSMGWTVALILAELNPDRQLEILQRGYEFGQSRVIVGAHFQSDVDMGRIVGSGLVARLHADPEFRARLTRARAEAQHALMSKQSGNN